MLIEITAQPCQLPFPLMVARPTRRGHRADAAFV
jgi:hypothetical protein